MTPELSAAIARIRAAIDWRRDHAPKFLTEEVAREDADLHTLLSTLEETQAVRATHPLLTAYETQVLIGTTISGCAMRPDTIFDLQAAWARLRSLGLIDRTDGLAIATPEGVALVAALSARPQPPQQPVATAGEKLIDDLNDLAASFPPNSFGAVGVIKAREKIRAFLRLAATQPNAEEAGK